MKKKKISARIIADSKNEHGQRITTFVLTYPRFIHAECKTHRILNQDSSYYEDTSLMNETMFSRNAASSRAIPVSKMIKDIEEDPFIPVAFQKAHNGMQGTEYIEDKIDIESVTAEWLYNVNVACSQATIMKDMGVTKQLVNRILEPYQWYTCIVTATEYDNFFELRCPQYKYEGKTYSSWKDVVLSSYDTLEAAGLHNTKLINRLKVNKGAGEIHISLLAEAMWDARNESEPKKLKAGEWHIPFGENLDRGRIGQLVPDFSTAPSEMSNVFNYHVNEITIKIATARCARVSYLNFEGKDDYEADIKLYDRLKEMGHMSPFEHCARAMSKEEYLYGVQGRIDDVGCEHVTYDDGSYAEDVVVPVEIQGWSGNFRGFVQLRKEIENAPTR